MAEVLGAEWALAWMREAEASVASARETLNALDRAIGDGDHGENMARGFGAVGVALAEQQPATPGAVFAVVARTLISTVGGASGPLYGTAFLRASKAVGETLDAEGVTGMLAALLEGVVARGGAAPGDKTMVDALHPAHDAAAGADSAADAIRAAAQAADAGAIATELARHGHKVGVLDADITGPSIPKMFGMSGRHVHALGNLMLPEISEHGVKVMSSNLLLQNETDPVLWRGPVIAGAIRQFWSETSWGPIDYLLVDMPPGTGDVALTVFQSLPVDGIVIVTSPQDLVSMIVAKAVNMAEKMNVPILGIVENMSYIECPDCGKKIEVFGKSKLPEVAERYNLDILGQLPINPALAEACDKGEVETALPDGMLPKAVSAVEAITPHETDEA